jgi:tRNA A37 threonylcarbamoyladenosine modification protein TsaB
MKLYIDGTDIREIGLSSDRFQTLVYKDAAPEAFLAQIDAFVEGDIDSVKEIHAYVGPGSSTALRSILSIVNTVHLTKNIPILGYEKTDEGPVEVYTDNRYLEPMYAHGPRITKSTHDNLNRKI